MILDALVRAYVSDHGLVAGTHPENLAAMRLHQWGHRFEQQLCVGRYHLDIAFLNPRIAVEIDGPHHLRPDVALKDAWRDKSLREAGWIIFRVNYPSNFEEQLGRISELLHKVR